MKKSSTTTTTTETPKNVYHIGGIPVEFPYKPYGTQLAFMGRVIWTLDRAQRDSHCHALLESPTGTGKSLSLLCSALAWQRHRGPKCQNPNPNQPQSRPDPRANSDPLNHGGGFIASSTPHLADSELSETSTPEEATPSASGKSQKKKTVPTIFYASRTHSQLSQVIREYRKTTYRVPMAILASRKHYCTNASIRDGNNLDEDCKLLLEDKESGCPQFKNAHRVKSHPSVQKGGCNEAHDIEDLVKVGKAVKGCSYFAARSMADDAQIVFCPYSYIINPVIRRAMEVDISGAILILDEAHNIEDMCRDAGSVDVDEDALQKLQTELGQLCGGDALTYQPLYEMVQDILSWMERRKNALEKREFQHYFSCWTGDKALRELQEANISQQCFPILKECAVKAIKAASDTESGSAHLSGMSAMILEGLFSSLSYFFHGNGNHIHDYQLVMQRFIKKDPGISSGSWILTLGLWCLNPAVVFKDIAELSLSIILTSGTLSPMNSFSSELGIPFGTWLEAPHVIDVESQVWASVISTGPGDYPLNASYKTADGFAFQDALGKSLEEIFKVVPGGTLVFFPSYKLMDKLCKRWSETGQWSQLNTWKDLFVEPRGGNQEEFDTVLKGYYSSIQGRKPAIGKRRKAKKVETNDCTTTTSLDICRKGAAFLAVFRGKVSEGIDFSDENARAVIIVGIPFPNIYDIQVAEKKRYNDTYKQSKNLLSGSEWYCHQAFRALNQATGRCIRHRCDYGAIILLDERFREERNIAYISKWLRKSIRTSEKFETSVEDLRSFFCNIKERVGKANMLQDAVTDLENIPPVSSGKGSVKRKSQKLSKPETGEKRTVLDNMMMASNALSPCLSFEAHGNSGHVRVKPQSNDKTQESAPAYLEDIESQKGNIDVYSSCREDLRCETPSTASLDERLELSVVKETPMAGHFTVASPETSINDDNSHSTLIQTFHEFGQATSLSCSMDVTPERNSRGHTKGLMQEIESSVNLSVNSHAPKRRTSLSSPLINSIPDMKFDMATAEITQDFRERGYSVGKENPNQSSRFSLKTNPLECKVKSSVLASVENEDDKSSKSAGLCLDQQLQISCSLCKSSLGQSENNSYVTGSLTLISKNILTALSEGKGQHEGQTSPSGLPVVIVDILSVDCRLRSRNNRDLPGQGIWCQEDGCVYNTIFCPFCISPNHSLGVQIMATDASNAHLINKILFLYDRLEIKSDKGLKRKDSRREKEPPPNEIVDISSIGKYAYQSQQQSSGGWRVIKPKSRPPKRSPTLLF